VTLAGDVVTGRFEQSVMFDGMPRPSLPAVEPAGGSAWYEQFKVPVVACSFVVREATALEFPTNTLEMVWGVEWHTPERRLVFEADERFAVACAYPNLEVTASDRVVGYRRRRHWRILSMVSDDRWEDE
jgi:hypothetical protein